MTISRWEGGAEPEFEDWLQIERLTGLTPNDFYRHRVILARRKTKESMTHGK